MSDNLGKPVRYKGPGQWRSEAEAAQAHTRPPDAALEVLPEVSRSAPVDGLDWDPVEYLMLLSRAGFNPHLHPRRPPGGDHGGEFAPKGGGGGRPSGWPTNAPAPRQPERPGLRPAPGPLAAGEGPDLTVTDLMSMVSDLHRRFDEQAPQLHQQNAQQLRQVTEQIRAEEARIAKETAEAEKVADLKDEKRKAIIKAVVRVLALTATAGLILATHGAALPLVGVLGVEFGPLIGGELGVALAEAHSRRKARARLSRAVVMPQARDQVVAAMTMLIAKMTGDEQAAPQLAEDLVADAEDQLPADSAAEE